MLKKRSITVQCAPRTASPSESGPVSSSCSRRTGPWSSSAEVSGVAGAVQEEIRSKCEEKNKDVLPNSWVYLRREVHEVGLNPKLDEQVEGPYRVIETDGRVFKLRIGDDDVPVSSDRITPAPETADDTPAERVLFMTLLHPWTRTRMVSRPRKRMTQCWKESKF
jgi:hypothetical protein